MNSQQILDREFLVIRAKILEVAAALDRIDRADGEANLDSRMALIKDAIEVISQDQPEAIRAEKIQLLFSRTYDDKWLEDFAIASRT